MRPRDWWLLGAGMKLRTLWQLPLASMVLASCVASMRHQTFNMGSMTAELRSADLDTELSQPL